MKKCKICNTPTDTVFNISFKAVPVCESCAASIFVQQSRWYVEITKTKRIPTIVLSEFKNRREVLGFTMRHVCLSTGVSISTISRIERGFNSKHSNVEKLHRFYIYKKV